MKSKSPKIPETPSFQADPNVGWAQDTLKGQVPNMLSLSNLPAPLMEALNTSPDITRLTLQGLQAQLEPSYRQGFQNITNTLAANNQDTSSTAASALGNYEGDYLAQLTAAGANAGIADINRALQNRVSLYGTGLNTASQIGQLGLNNQGQENQFALQNYENQVAQALLNQPAQRGGFTGALTGAFGGALAAAPTGNPYLIAAGAGVGGLSGGLGQPGTGGQFLGAGASMYGNRNMGIPSITPSLTSGGGEQIYNPIYAPLSSNPGLNIYGDLASSFGYQYPHRLN